MRGELSLSTSFTAPNVRYPSVDLFLFSHLTHGIGILQMLGCIPRTPSPIPQLNNLEEAVIKPDDPQEQLRALRVSLRGMTYPAALC